jgi:hypothetical protein
LISPGRLFVAPRWLVQFFGRKFWLLEVILGPRAIFRSVWGVLVAPGGFLVLRGADFTSSEGWFLLVSSWCSDSMVQVLQWFRFWFLWLPIKIRWLMGLLLLLPSSLIQREEMGFLGSVFRMVQMGFLSVSQWVLDYLILLSRLSYLGQCSVNQKENEGVCVKPSQEQLKRACRWLGNFIIFKIHIIQEQILRALEKEAHTNRGKMWGATIKGQTDKQIKTDKNRYKRKWKPIQ